MLPSALRYSHDLLREVIAPGDTVLDGTVGNGHDTALLAELVGESGKVYGFDVQAVAIQRTSERLTTAGLAAQVTLLQQGHETLATIIPETPCLKAAVFNLGYLPHSDKEIITTATTTLTALEALFPRLLPGGRIILVVYYGHPGGEAEKQGVLDFVSALPQHAYNVLAYHFINQQNNPPLLVAIEKKKKSLNA